MGTHGFEEATQAMMRLCDRSWSGAAASFALRRISAQWRGSSVGWLEIFR